MVQNGTDHFQNIPGHGSAAYSQLKTMHMTTAARSGQKRAQDGHENLCEKTSLAHYVDTCRSLLNAKLLCKSGTPFFCKLYTTHFPDYCNQHSQIIVLDETTQVKAIRVASSIASLVYQSYYQRCRHQLQSHSLASEPSLSCAI